MNAKTRTTLELVGLAIGTFSVATLANLAAAKFAMEEKEHKKMGYYYTATGMAISGYLLYRINKRGIKTLI